ncbi:hypothetical protein FF38_08828 [Lucilia cuprina]|uniref:Uncharacterized protein n=1 Tax=Lucilia cuprina TaxID=7375 RepID=A0A0L0BT71_LUCCU|nr:hypothetical protein FF38_08828 [Lucilia cuprina]
MVGGNPSIYKETKKHSHKCKNFLATLVPRKMRDFAMCFSAKNFDYSNGFSGCNSSFYSTSYIHPPEQTNHSSHLRVMCFSAKNFDYSNGFSGCNSSFYSTSYIHPPEQTNHSSHLRVVIPNRFIIALLVGFDWIWEPPSTSQVCLRKKSKSAVRKKFFLN